MYELEKEILVCVHCQAEVQATDQFCPRCGMLFEQEMVCAQHHSVGAIGVCVVCARPFCGRCGGWKAKRFFCNQHADYAINESKVQTNKPEVFFGDTW